MKHTTGEWKAQIDHSRSSGNYPKTLIVSNGNLIAVCHKREWEISQEEAEANAKLISAAPDLLRAAHNALVTLEAMNRLIATTIATETRKELEAAIKKATE